MQAKTHSVFAILSVRLIEVIIPYFNLQYGLHYFTALFSALLPDIDTKNSTISNLHKNQKLKKNPLIFALLLPLIIPLLILSIILNLTLKHRGITHSCIFPLIIFAISAIVNNKVIFWIGVGYLSHIIADLLTISGVPLLFPFSKKRISILPIKTGGVSEKIVYIISIAMLICFVLKF